MAFPAHSLFRQERQRDRERERLSFDGMYHLLFVDEVHSLVYRVHERLQILAPVVKRLVGILGALECDDAREAVYLARDGLVDDQIGKELFRLVLGQVEQIGHAFCVDARVILGHHSHILSKFTKFKFEIKLPSILDIIQ